MRTFLLSAGLAAALTATALAESPEELLARIDDRRAFVDLDFELQITEYLSDQVVDANTLWGWSKSTELGNKTLLAFAEPASVKGRKMLMDGPTVYLLFPRTRNPIRLSPLQVLLGQSSNGDVARTGFAEQYTVQALSTSKTDDGEAWVFDLVARKDHLGSTYRRVKLWVDQAQQLPRAAEFYANADVLLKKVTYSDYRQVAGKYTAFRLEIHDGANPAQFTILQYTRMNTQGLPLSAFRAAYLPGWTPGRPR